MSRADQGKRSRRRREGREEVVVFTPQDEAGKERRLRCNQSKLRLRVRRPPAPRHPHLPEEV